MSASNFTTSGTKILPVVSDGEPVELDNLFEYLPMYEVVSGPHAGERGMKYDLEVLCGPLVVLPGAVDYETGAILQEVRSVMQQGLVA